MSDDPNKTTPMGEPCPASEGPAPSEGDTGHSSGNDDTVPMITPPGSAKKGDTEKFDQAQAASDPLIGATLGDYHIISLLGKGGFGTVYRARDVNLDRPAAIKFLRSHLDEEFRRLFEREAKVIAKLSSHPSIVQIFMWGEHQGQYYFALEYLGQSGEDLLKKNEDGLPIATALKIISDCAGALDFAHTEGVLHRDIKPANILIDSKTHRAKLCDFGLARFTNMGMNSASGTISGTPLYMSPEQASGTRLDERSDVYSLGVTLYQLLSGRLPVEGDSHLEIMENIKKQKTTPFRRQRPDLPDGLVDIIDKAMSHKPEHRYQSAKEFEDDVNSALKSFEHGATIEPKRLRPARMLSTMASSIIAATALLLVVLLAVVVLTDRNENYEWPQALAAMKDKMDHGDIAGAGIDFEAHLLENPGDEHARYGYAYTLLRRGKVDEAAKEFAKLTDTEMRAEGEAALAHASDWLESREELEGAGAESLKGYSGVLLASLDLQDARYDEALAQLDGVNASALKFNWQRSKLDQIRGRVLMKLGRFEEAQGAFDQVVASGGSDGDAYLMATYAALAASNSKADRLARISAQVGRVKELLDAQPVSKDDLDRWSSRPVRVWLQATPAGKSRIAAEGLADVLPLLLGEALSEGDEYPISTVDRDLLEDMLLEQELTSLGSQDNGVRLGKLLGARVIVSAEFTSYLGEESLRGKLVDSETTQARFFNDLVISETMDPREFVATVANRIRGLVVDSYPIQGRVTQTTDALELNIGSDEWVREGMKFRVFTKVDPPLVIEGLVAVVAAPPGPSSATLRFEGDAPGPVPSTGWYVQAIPEDGEA